MSNIYGLYPAIEKLQKQLIDIQKIYQPAISQQITSIDLTSAFNPLIDSQLKLVQTNLPFALPQWLEQLNQITQSMQPQILNIALSSLELTNKLNNILPYIQDELIELKELKTEDFSKDEIEELEEISNTFNQISETAKNNKLTVGDWVGIISLLLTIVFRIFPEGPSEEIVKPLTSLVTIVYDYTQHSLDNQELVLEKIDKLTETVKHSNQNLPNPD